MPSTNGKPHMLAQPPKNMQVGESLFVINSTGEMFKTKKEFESRSKSYEEAKWMCKCTGRSSLTYEQALKSESDARDKLSKIVSPIHSDSLVNVIKNSSDSIDSLVDSCYSKLSSTLNVGEKVVCSIYKDLVRGQIDNIHFSKSNSPSAMSDKENSVNHKVLNVIELSPSISYDVKTEKNEVIPDVSASDLKRVMDVPNKDTLRRFITANFNQYSNNSKWSIDPHSSLKTKSMSSTTKRKSTGSNPSSAKKKKPTTPKGGATPLKDFLSNSNKALKLDKSDSVLVTKNTTPKQAKAKPSKKSTDPKSKPAKSPKTTSAKKATDKTPKSSKKNVETPASKKKTKEDSSGKKMKQMTLFDLPSKTPKTPTATKKPKEKSKDGAKATPKSSTKTSAKKSASKKAKDTKSTKKTAKKTPKDKLKQKNPKSVKISKEKMKKASKSLKKALDMKNLQKTALFTKVKATPSKDGAKASTTAPSTPAFTTVNMQELQFKLLMKKALQAHTAGRRKYCLLICRKSSPLYDTKYAHHIPAPIKEDFYARIDFCIQKQDPSQVKPSVLAEYHERRKALEERKKALESAAKAISNQPLVDDKFLELTPLPEAKLVVTLDGIPNELFGEVAMITEFIHCYQGLLLSNSGLIYANDLMEALVCGKQSFHLLSKLLVALLQTLLLDEIAEEYEELGFKLNKLPINEYTASELLRLCLRVDDTLEKDNDDNEDGDNVHYRNDEVPEELISEIESVEFYEMDVQSKLKILTGLMHRVLSTYAVQQHNDQLHNNFTKLINKKRSDMKEENEAKKLKKQEEEGKKQLENQKNATEGDANEPGKSSNVTNGTSELKEDSPTVDDLASLVKNRRLLAKKAMEEKEMQDQLKKKEIDKQNLNIECQEALQKWKRLVRLGPLGLDRNHDRYWLFSSTQPIVCVEKGWVSFLDYHVDKPIEDDVSETSSYNEDNPVENSSDAVPDASTADSSPATATPKEETLPMPGQNLWFCYDTIEDVDELLKCLGNGIREKALKTQLKNVRPTLNLSKRRAGKEFQKEDCNVALMEGLRSEIVDFASDLIKGGMGHINNFDKWCSKVRKTSTIKDLAEFILDIHNCVIPRFFSKMFNVVKKDSNEKNGNAKLVQYWKDAVSSCQTLSRLHVLAAILESCIKWDESSANVRCKVCRQKRSESQTIVCSKCKCGYHLQCLRPILHSIPEDDWLCSKCLPQNAGLRSSRKNYAQSGSENEDDQDEDESFNEEDGEKAEDDDEEEAEAKQCAVCGDDDGDLIHCSCCPDSFHGECHQPPMKNPPRGMWACCQCVTGKKVQVVYKSKKGRQTTRGKKAAVPKRRSSRQR